MKYIQDGYLVVGGISQRGCVSYRHSGRSGDVDGVRLEEDWSTHKTVLDVNEQRRLKAAKNTLTRKILRLGAPLANFGVYVRQDKAEELEAVLREVDAEVRTYNASARYTYMLSSFTVFQILGGDERIARALYDRAVNLIDEISTAIGKGDVKAIRSSLRGLRGLDEILPAETGAEISKAINEARAAAREATKAVKDSTGTDDEKAEAMAEQMKNIDLGGIRASLIETSEDLEKKTSETAYVPDLVNARQIEQ